MSVLVVDRAVAQLVVSSAPDAPALVAVEQVATLVAVAAQGPSGPKGEDGDSTLDPNFVIDGGNF